jgi:hypothetical protein
MFIPFCFLWVFISCVINCAAHASEAQLVDIAWSIDEPTCLPENDCCPIRVSNLSLLPDRRSPLPQIEARPLEHYASSNIRFLQRLQSGASLRPHSSVSETPLERSCALRI